MTLIYIYIDGASNGYVPEDERERAEQVAQEFRAVGHEVELKEIELTV